MEQGLFASVTRLACATRPNCLPYSAPLQAPLIMTIKEPERIHNFKVRTLFLISAQPFCVCRWPISERPIRNSDLFQATAFFGERRSASSELVTKSEECAFSLSLSLSLSLKIQMNPILKGVAFAYLYCE